MIFTLFAWFAISPKVWTNNRNNAALFLVAFSIFISTLLSPYEGLGNNLTTENWFKVFVFFLLIMTSVKTEKDLKVLITAFTVCFTLYMLHSLREYRCGRHTFRMGIARMLGVDSTMNDPNAFGNGINYAIPLLLPLLIFAREQTTKRRKQLLLILAITSFLLSIICIQLTGSRSSFVALGISLTTLALLSKYRFRVLVLLCVAAPIVWFSLPADLQNRYLTVIYPELGPTSAQESAESRIVFFWMGIDIWKENLPFGVGPSCFPYASGTGVQSHGFIPQVTSELGTLGVVAYLMLIGCTLANSFESRSLCKKMKAMGREKEALYFHRVSFAVAFTVFLLILLGFGGHNAFRFTWIWYAAFQAIAVGILRQKVDALSRLPQQTPRVSNQAPVQFGQNRTGITSH